MKITFTINADITAEEIVSIMQEEARQQEERDERFNKNRPPIFATEIPPIFNPDSFDPNNKKKKPN